MNLKNNDLALWSWSTCEVQGWINTTPFHKMQKNLV